jgi:L-lactate dehydrogenase (cytochrome)
LPSLKYANSVADFHELARKRLPMAVMDFVEGGAEDEITIARNRHALQSLALVPRALTDVSARDQRTTLLGTAVASPIVLAPVGLAALAHPAGEVAAARAASQHGIISTLSSSSAWSLEDVARSSTGPKWFQLYIWRDRELTRALVERARAAGYLALCLTIDVAVSGRRARDLRNGFTIPPRPRLSQSGDFIRHAGWFTAMVMSELRGHGLAMGNFTAADVGMRARLRMLDVVNELFDPSVTWRDIEWLKSIWGGPLVIKGIMTGPDAKRCLDAGADAVWVSNHGGRQLDGLKASVHALPDVVEAVDGKAEVYVDGGFRRGTDVVKALSLGARACMIGRPYVYGLAAAGQAGAEKVITILRAEIDSALALLGRPRLADLDATAVEK